MELESCIWAQDWGLTEYSSGCGDQWLDIFTLGLRLAHQGEIEGYYTIFWVLSLKWSCYGVFIYDQVKGSRDDEHLSEYLGENREQSVNILNWSLENRPYALNNFVFLM